VKARALLISIGFVFVCATRITFAQSYARSTFVSARECEKRENQLWNPGGMGMRRNGGVKDWWCFVGDGRGGGRENTPRIDKPLKVPQMIKRD
jgi:hypothetical protein